MGLCCNFIGFKLDSLLLCGILKKLTSLSHDLFTIPVSSKPSSPTRQRAEKKQN